MWHRHGRQCSWGGLLLAPVLMLKHPQQLVTGPAAAKPDNNTQEKRSSGEQKQRKPHPEHQRLRCRGSVGLRYRSTALDYFVLVRSPFFLILLNTQMHCFQQRGGVNLVATTSRSSSSPALALPRSPTARRRRPPAIAAAVPTYFFSQSSCWCGYCCCIVAVFAPPQCCG